MTRSNSEEAKGINGSKEIWHCMGKPRIKGVQSSGQAAAEAFNQDTI